MPLPCWDESDDGVPPFCRGEPPVASWKFFNHEHPVTNHNMCCHIWGNIGWKCFDVKRSRYMGLAMLGTLLSMGFTAYACFALSSDPDIVQVTKWASLEFTNTTNSDDSFSVAIGLRSMVISSNGERRSFPFTLMGSLSDGDRQDMARLTGAGDALESFAGKCAEGVGGNAAGALITCITLLPGLSGTMNRMRLSADANIQKALGMVTDTWGALSLAYTMYNFGITCYAEVPRRHSGFAIEAAMGPGWWCYVVCVVFAIVRASMHWLTPTPGLGAGGCSFEVPEMLLAAIERGLESEAALVSREVSSARSLLSQEAKLATHRLIHGDAAPQHLAAADAGGAAGGDGGAAHKMHWTCHPAGWHRPVHKDLITAKEMKRAALVSHPHWGGRRETRLSLGMLEGGEVGKAAEGEGSPFPLAATAGVGREGGERLRLEPVQGETVRSQPGGDGGAATAADAARLEEGGGDGKDGAATVAVDMVAIDMVAIDAGGDSAPAAGCLECVDLGGGWTTKPDE